MFLISCYYCLTGRICWIGKLLSCGFALHRKFANIRFFVYVLYFEKSRSSLRKYCDGAIAQTFFSGLVHKPELILSMNEADTVCISQSLILIYEVTTKEYNYNVWDDNPGLSEDAKRNALRSGECLCSLWMVLV